MKNYVESTEIVTIPAPAEGTTSGTGVQVGFLFGVATTTVASRELVTNGRLTTDTSWTKGVGWTISNGVATSDASQVADADLSQTAAVVSGEYYLTTMTVTRTAGKVTMVVGGTEGTDRALTGTYTEIIQAGADGTIIVRADLDFAGTVDLVSVVHVENIVSNGVFASDTIWTKGTGWSIAGGVAAIDGSQAGNSDLSQSVFALNPGEPYWCQYTVAGYAAGNVKIMIGGTSGTTRSANGTYTEYLIAGSGDTVVIRGDLDYSATTGADNVWVVSAKWPEVAIAVKGVVDLAKPTSLAVSAGDKLWFNPNLGQVTKTSTASLPVGIAAAAAAANTETTVKTLLKPIPAVGG